MRPPDRESGTCRPATLGSTSGVSAEAAPAVLRPSGPRMAYRQVRRAPSRSPRVHEWRIWQRRRPPSRSPRVHEWRIASGACRAATLGSTSGVSAEAAPAVLRPSGPRVAYRQRRRLPSCDPRVHEWRIGRGGACRPATLGSMSGVPQGGAMVLWCGPPADRPRASSGGEPISWRLGAMVRSAAAASPAGRLEYWVTTSGGANYDSPTRGRYRVPL